MHFNRFTHLNDTPAVQNSRILQFSKIRPQSLCNVIIPWSIKYMWFNAAHSLLILTSPNCSLIRGHFPVWCGGRCTAPGGVGLRPMSGRLRAVSGRLRTAPDGSGRLRTAFSRTVVRIAIRINIIRFLSRFWPIPFGNKRKFYTSVDFPSENVVWRLTVFCSRSFVTFSRNISTIFIIKT